MTFHRKVVGNTNLKYSASRIHEGVVLRDTKPVSYRTKDKEQDKELRALQHTHTHIHTHTHTEENAHACIEIMQNFQSPKAMQLKITFVVV